MLYKLEILHPSPIRTLPIVPNILPNYNQGTQTISARAKTITKISIQRMLQNSFLNHGITSRLQGNCFTSLRFKFTPLTPK